MLFQMRKMCECKVRSNKCSVTPVILLARKDDRIYDFHFIKKQIQMSSPSLIWPNFDVVIKIEIKNIFFFITVLLCSSGNEI